MSSSSPSSSSWQLHTVLLLVLLHSSSQQVAQDGECVLQQNGHCPPSHSNYKTTPLTIIQSTILQKLSSIQLDLTIVTSELDCRQESPLLNATRSTINAVMATDFRALFSSCHGSELICCSGQGSKPTLCNCNGLFTKCLGGAGLKFLTTSWRELVDNLRTSLRILLSEESNRCALPSSGSYLSKLHGSRDLGNWMQCEGTSRQHNCLQVAMATGATGSRQQLTSLLTTSSEKLKLYWPTTTTTTTAVTRSGDHQHFGSMDDQLELGSGYSSPRLLRQQSDQDSQFGGSGGGGLDGMITDDEDLLGGGSDFGSGDSDTPDESTPPPQEETILVVTTTTNNSNNRESSSPRQLASSLRLIIVSIAVRLICR